MTFEQWRDSLPPDHWARYDLSACKLGWDAAIKIMVEKAASKQRPAYDEQQKRIARLDSALREIQDTVKNWEFRHGADYELTSKVCAMVDKSLTDEIKHKQPRCKKCGYPYTPRAGFAQCPDCGA